jgi:DNA-binding winged helix-turn-helix (wHTH) protein/Tol biopolymer transport system component
MGTTSRSPHSSEILQFSDFKIDLRAGELHRNGSVVRLQRQPFEVLAHLARHAGEVVTREELHQRLWQSDTFVDFDNGLNAAISKVREALGDSTELPRYLETLPRRGYRFIAAVQAIPSNGAEPGLPRGESSPAIPARAEESDRSVVPISQAPGRTRHWYGVFAVLLVASLAAVTLMMIRHSERNAPALAFEQLLTANPPEAPITAAAISPDGSYLAYADPTGVYIRQMAGGETRPLPLPQGFVAGPTSWFPDGTHVLLDMEGPGGTVPSLWKISIFGGGPQKIVENASGGAVSPDGLKIAFLRTAFRVLEIWIADSDGSNPSRIVEDAGPEGLTGAGGLMTHPLYTGFASRLAWSPGGNRIAYLRSFAAPFPDPTMDNRYALETVDIHDGTRRLLKESAQLRPAICWSADGRLIYAYRDDAAGDGGDVGIWAVPVDGRSGAAEGSPRQLTKGLGRVVGMSATADGKRLAVWRSRNRPAVFIADFDPGIRHFKTPRRLTLDENMNVGSAWTPDSRAVLFSSNRQGSWKLFHQGIEQAMPEVLAEGDRNPMLPRVNPEGTEILYMNPYDAGDPEHLGDIVSVPISGGTRRVVLRRISVGNIACARFPSKLCLLNVTSGSTMKFLSFDPENGKTQPFGTFKMDRGISSSLSPDGSQLVMVPFPGSKIVFMTIGNKRTREVELKGWAELTTVDWTANSKSVYVIARTANGTDEVVEVEPSGNHQMLLESDSHTHFWWAIQSPDGQHILLQETTGESNVWVAENF